MSVRARAARSLPARRRREVIWLACSVRCAAWTATVWLSIKRDVALGGLACGDQAGQAGSTVHDRAHVQSGDRRTHSSKSWAEARCS